MKPDRSDLPDARWQIPGMLLLVGVICTGVARWCPEDGWALGDMPIRWSLPEAWRPWLGPEEAPVVVPRWKPEDVQAMLAEYDAQWLGDSTEMALSEPDSTLEGEHSNGSHSDGPPTIVPDVGDPSGHPEGTPDSAAVTAPPVARSNTTGTIGRHVHVLPSALRIRMPDAALPGFERLFERLASGESVHVLHYGDSQIEGDRISGTLRHIWQERWGGYGPGLQPPIPLVQSFALRQSASGPWQRHTRFGRRDSLDADEHYGLLASYADLDGSSDDPVCLTVGTEPRNHPAFGRWDRLTLWHDTVRVKCAIEVNGVAVDTLRPGESPAALPLPETAMTAGGSPIQLCFSAPPPRLFALHPEGSGVQWHNVAMRGSSGTLFRKLERRPFADQLKRIRPDLILLQFGGNTVPYIQDTTAARRYGGWFSRQIALFQSLHPDAAILVIGPSDMAEKTGLQWTSYPMLVPVRDALLDATLDRGAAYWDLLEAMGGVGSMPAWVASVPPLAGADHVHFTPQGAKQVGQWLDRALVSEYERWTMGGRTEPVQTLPSRPTPTLPSVPLQSPPPHVP